MDVLSLISQNKEVAKLIYGIFIWLICLIIVLKTNKLFKLSHHQGIRYFRNAFFFYGIAFFIRYIIGSVFLPDYISLNNLIIKLFFEFFVVMAGFFLIYSLIWKRFETPLGQSSLFNLRILIFYLLTLLIIIFDFIWQSYYAMFISQIIIFILASGISFLNYANNGDHSSFLKFYFLAMLLSLFAWILNGLAGLYFNWSELILIEIYISNIIIFVLFLYGVLKIIK